MAIQCVKTVWWPTPASRTWYLKASGSLDIPAHSKSNPANALDAPGAQYVLPLRVAESVTTRKECVIELAGVKNQQLIIVSSAQSVSVVVQVEFLIKAAASLLQVECLQAIYREQEFLKFGRVSCHSVRFSLFHSHTKI
jgi:hypothetical protein